MPDKEIIIDGVDVSGCEFLWKEKLPKRFCNNGNLDCDCNSNPNCYYKQLKRKEQECERLGQTLIQIKEIAENGIDDKEIMAVQIMLNGSPDPKNKVLKQILQKISEVENGR